MEIASYDLLCNILEYKYTLRGENGDEEITVRVGDMETTIPITTTATEYTVHGSKKIFIKFKNDNALRTVYFESQSPFAIIMGVASGSTDWWKLWSCGYGDEDGRCGTVRDGRLDWNGEYIITFGGMFMVFQLQC